MDNNGKNTSSEEFIFSGEDTEGKASAKPSADDEFIIPDTLDLSADFGDKPKTSPATDYAETLWKPYVPKFTEITENRYYFADTSAEPKSAPADKKAPPETAAAPKPATPSISVERVDGRARSEDDKNDPTAEIRSTVPDAVVVNIKGKKAPSDSTLNVFKFKDGKSESKDSEPTDEEKERIEIASLTGHVFDKADDVKADDKSEAPVSDEEPTSHISDAPEADSYREQRDKIKLHEQEFKIRASEYDYAPSGEEKPSEKHTTDTSDYNSFAMKDSFKDMFLDSIMAIRIRIIVAIVLSAAVALLELFPSKIVAFLGIGSAINAPVLIDIALIVSLMIITLPELIGGIRMLIGKQMSSEVCLFISGLAIIGSSLYFGIATDKQFFLGSVYAVMAVNTLFANYYWQKANFTAFKTVSCKGVKHIIDCRITRTLETHNMALDGKVDEHRSVLAKVFPATFVSGFFKNSVRRREGGKNCILWLGIVFGVAIALGVSIYFIIDLPSAVASFALAVALGAPAASSLTHKLPYSSAEDKLYHEGNAVIGEEAMYGISKADVLIFEDTEVFGEDDVTLKSASDKRSNYYDSMRKMASLFAATGSPLTAVFESSLNKKCAPAEDVTIDDDGMSGYVDGCLIEAGTRDYMQKKNIAVPYQTELHVGGTRVIYAAENGEFFGAFTVNYSFSEEFAHMLSEMNESGIVPLVYTRDFNITGEFMKGLTRGNDVIRVMRKYDTAKEQSPRARVCSAAVVAPEKESALSEIVTAKKYSSLISLLSLLEVSLASFGALAAVVIALIGKTFVIPSVAYAVYQIAVSAVFSIIGKSYFKIKETQNAE